MSFRDNLQHLRAQNNMTQEQLAMLLGVSRQSVTKWESEKSYPEMDKLLSLCQIFGCTLDDLVQGDLTSQSFEHAVAVSSHAVPVDLFGYDDQMRSFASKISGGVMSIILGVALSCLLSADEELWAIPENILAALTLICVFGGVGIGLSLIIPASLEHARFVRKHPYIEDFYTEEQKASASSAFARHLIFGIACIFVGIVITVLFADTVYEPFAVSAMMLLIAVGVRFIIYGGMMLGRTNIQQYNLAASEVMDAAEIQSSGMPSDQTNMVLSHQRIHKRIGAICGTIMIVATIAGLVMLFVPGYQSPLFWLAWPIGGLCCAVVATLMKGFSAE